MTETRGHSIEAQPSTPSRTAPATTGAGTAPGSETAIATTTSAAHHGKAAHDPTARRTEPNLVVDAPAAFALLVCFALVAHDNPMLAR